jgi:hypothetical protein
MTEEVMLATTNNKGTVTDESYSQQRTRRAQWARELSATANKKGNKKDAMTEEARLVTANKDRGHV